MLLWMRVEAPAPIRRTPAPSGRLPLLAVPGLLGVQDELVFGKRSGCGALAPWTRFDEISESATSAVEPAVTRRPSWPNVGPVKIGAAFWHMPSSTKFGQLFRPMIFDDRITTSFTTPDGLSGGLGPVGRGSVAPSIQTPTSLYLSTRVWFKVRVRGDAPGGGEVACVAWATPKPKSSARQPPGWLKAFARSEVMVLVTRSRTSEPCASRNSTPPST